MLWTVKSHIAVAAPMERGRMSTVQCERGTCLHLWFLHSPQAMCAYECVCAWTLFSSWWIAEWIQALLLQCIISHSSCERFLSIHSRFILHRELLLIQYYSFLGLAFIFFFTLCLHFPCSWSIRVWLTPKDLRNCSSVLKVPSVFWLASERPCPRFGRTDNKIGALRRRLALEWPRGPLRIVLTFLTHHLFFKWP